MNEIFNVVIDGQRFTQTKGNMPRKEKEGVYSLFI